MTEIIRDFCRYILIVENQLLSLMYCFVMFCFVLIITVNMSLVVALVKGRIFIIIWCLREEKPMIWRRLEKITVLPRIFSRLYLKYANSSPN